MTTPQNRSRRPERAPQVQPVAGRVPPHDLDAEGCVLSAILLSRDALDRVLEILKPDHFYSDANRFIFEAAIALTETSTPVDLQTVCSWLRDREKLARIGGPSYLAQLSDATPSVANVFAYATTVFEKWRLRQLIATCQRIAAEGYGDVGDVQTFIDGAEQAVYELAHGGRASEDGGLLRDHLQAAFSEIVEAAERGEQITGVSTGYKKLDSKTSGMHEGDLWIVAARPGMGKTSLAMNIAVNVGSPRPHQVYSTAADERQTEIHEATLGVVAFSCEMPGKQLATRTASTEGRVDLGLLRNGLLQVDDWRRLTTASAFLSPLPIWVETIPSLTVLKTRARVRRRQAEFNRPAVFATATDGKTQRLIRPERRIGLVIVDYLQLMKGREGVNSREQEISEISRGLKELSLELGVPVMALSQLNRAVETRSTKDKRPQLSDLRESGAIEQDADTIIFVYRDEYYNPETSNAKGIAELIIAKQRNGPTGKVLTRFTASCTRFDNLAPGDYQEEEDER